MKKSFFVLALIISYFTHAQVDTFLVENTFSFKIVDGKRTYQKSVINQKTFSMDGILLREFDYDSLYKISSYTYYYYSDNQLKSKETYAANNQLKSAILFEKEDDNKKDIYYSLSDGKLKVDSAISTTSIANRIVSKNGLNSKNKWYYTDSYQYKDTLLTEVVRKIHPKRAVEGIVPMITRYEYDDNGFVIKTSYYRIEDDHEVLLAYSENEYNDKQQLKYIRAYSNTEQLITETQHNWDSNNNLNSIVVKSGDKKVLKHLMIQQYLKDIDFGGIESVFK